MLMLAGIIGRRSEEEWNGWMDDGRGTGKEVRREDGEEEEERRGPGRFQGQS
jgi:hypothetical protein